jgi:hypothetical protein
LTSDNSADAQKAYFRANSIQRSNISAASLATGIFSSASVPVHKSEKGIQDLILKGGKALRGDGLSHKYGRMSLDEDNARNS